MKNNTNIQTNDNQVPVYDLDAVVAQSSEHKKLIDSIKEEVSTDYDNINSPVPFIVTASS